MSGLVSDGDRFAAWQRGDVLTVLDATTGTRRRYAQDSCQATGLGAATVVSACNGGGETLDLRSGARVAFPAPTLPPGENTPYASFEAVGRRWVRLRVSDYHSGYDIYLDRSNPAGRYVTAAPLASQVADLNAPGLIRSLCSPIQAPDWRDASGLRLERAPFTYAYPYGAAPAETDAEDPVARLLLWRCGHRAQVLDRCACVPAIGSGHILWSYSAHRPGRSPGTVIRLRALAGGPTTSWVLPHRSLVTAVHLKDRLLVAQHDGLFTAPIQHQPGT